MVFCVGVRGPKRFVVGEGFFCCALAAVAGPALPPRLIWRYGEHPAFESFDAWLGTASEAPLADAPQLADDVLQLYTSGTTGLPKGVVLTNANYRTFLEAEIGRAHV